MNETKGAARIFDRGWRYKNLLSPKNKKNVATFFLVFLIGFFALLIGFRCPLELFVPPYIFFHQHQTLIWPTYLTFLQPIRRLKAPPIDLRQGRSSNSGVNFRLREHTCQWHCYKKSYFLLTGLKPSVLCLFILPLCDVIS